MQNDDEKIIALSKKKIVLIIIGSCVLVAVGVALLTANDAIIHEQHRYNNAAFVHAVGLVSVVLFSLFAIFGVKKLLDKRPGLIFNSSGFTDNASGISAGFVAWSEITGLRVLQTRKQKLLVIKVSNPQHYIERGGLLRRMQNRMNQRICGSPVVVAANALESDFTDLKATFEHYLQRYGGV